MKLTCDVNSHSISGPLFVRVNFLMVVALCKRFMCSSFQLFSSCILSFAPGVFRQSATQGECRNWILSNVTSHALRYDLVLQQQNRSLANFWQSLANDVQPPRDKVWDLPFFVNKKSEDGKCYIHSVMTENLQSFPTRDFSRLLISSIKKPPRPEIIFSHLYCHGHQSEEWGRRAIRKCHRKMIQIYWVLLVVWQKVNLGVVVSTVHEGIMKTHSSRGEYFPSHVSNSGRVLSLR